MNIEPIEPNRYVVTFQCVTYQDAKTVQSIVSNAIALMQEQFVETQGTIRQVIKPLDLQCGYCKNPSIAWIDWRTIGRPKGAPVCQKHLNEMNTPDNFGEYPNVKYYERTDNDS
jgi:hypothetical protein